MMFTSSKAGLENIEVHSGSHSTFYDISLVICEGNCCFSYAGTRFWRYDSENDQVFRKDPEGHRYPRLISEGFPGVIGPIDTAFYDRRDSHIYFFRNSLVRHNSLIFPPTPDKLKGTDKIGPGRKQQNEIMKL